MISNVSNQEEFRQWNINSSVKRIEAKHEMYQIRVSSNNHQIISKGGTLCFGLPMASFKVIWRDFVTEFPYGKS